ncbi:MAG: secretin N-terminal domain-containing protein [Planctomycetota bacterium]|jgi:hypothetical protein
MKIRTLIVYVWAVVLIAGVLSAQEATVLKPAASLKAEEKPPSDSATGRSSRRYTGTSTTRPAPESVPTIRSRRSAPPEDTPTEVRIFELKYARAADLGNMIVDLFRVRALHSDQRLHRLIVSATKEQLDAVANLIEEMDVPGPEVLTARDVQGFVYRVYMLEVTPEDRSLKPFSMRLQASTQTQVSAQEFLDSIAGPDLHISEFSQTYSETTMGTTELVIQGRAASNAPLRQLVDNFPQSSIIELKWDDDETFTDNIAAAQSEQLSEQMQKHIRKFLGEDIQTVGYWFGNLSAPGGLKAPIGPWTLRLTLDTESDRMLELTVDVEMPDETDEPERTMGRPRNRNAQILSNTIRTEFGKPIIIGYNRESYGTRKMGAMVIVPEPDSVGSDTAKSKRF